MNRDIKFRAWDEVSEKMLNWNEFLDTKMKNTFIAPESTGLILMQYTGLHDKNGKEIYEGDIVLLDCYYYEEPAFGGEFKVIYDDINGMWLLVDLENKDRGFAFGEIRSYYKAEIEVIGNIYDNPEITIKEHIAIHKKMEELECLQ